MPQGLGNFQEARRKREEATPSEMHLGVSENSVPLHPMVLLIIIPIKWLFHWEYTLFSDKPFEYPNRCNTLGNASSSSEAPLQAGRNSLQ